MNAHYPSTFPVSEHERITLTVCLPVRPEREFGLLNQLAAVIIADPEVAGNAQQGQAHLVGDAIGDGAKGAVAVGEVAGIFPEKVADEGFGLIFITAVLQEKVLDFSGDAPDVKDAVGSLHIFQVDGHNVRSTE